jgi:CheY-like chemotaxis protein
MSTVLTVDDEPGARRALSRVLARAGYHTVGAADGREALRALEQSAPDLVLLDVMMPGLSGLELLEILHDDARWRSLPVVMMTAISDTHTVNRAHQLGAKAYLVKATFSIAEMLENVRRYTGPASEGQVAGNPRGPQDATTTQPGPPGGMTCSLRSTRPR